MYNNSASHGYDAGTSGQPDQKMVGTSTGNDTKYFNINDQLQKQPQMIAGSYTGDNFTNLSQQKQPSIMTGGYTVGMIGGYYHLNNHQFHQFAPRCPVNSSTNSEKQQPQGMVSGYSEDNFNLPSQQNQQGRASEYPGRNSTNLSQQLQPPRMAGGRSKGYKGGVSGRNAEGNPYNPIQQQHQQGMANQYAENNVNSSSQQPQGMSSAPVDFGDLSDEQQAHWFNRLDNYVQHRIANMGDRRVPEIEQFRLYCIGQEKKKAQGEKLAQGNAAIAHAHEVAPVNKFNNSQYNHGSGPQHMPPPNAEGFHRSIPMSYSNPGMGLIPATSSQNPATPSLIIEGQVMQPINKQNFQKSPKISSFDEKVRLASVNSPSAGNPYSPVHSPAIAVSTPPPAKIAHSIMTASAYSQAAAALASLPAKIAHPIMTVLASSQATAALAPPSATIAPSAVMTASALHQRVQDLQTGNMEPKKEGKQTKGKGKRAPRRQKEQNSPTAEPEALPISQPMPQSKAQPTRHQYISVANLVPEQDIPKEEKGFHDLLNVELGKIPPNPALVENVMVELLKQSIVLLQRDSSSDTQRDLDYYSTSSNLCYEIGNLTLFAPKTQFVEEEVKVSCGKETKFINDLKRVEDSPILKNSITNIVYDPIHGFLNGRSVKGTYTMYTRTVFIDKERPLNYSVGVKIENVMVDGAHAEGVLIYERPLPKGPGLEPRWTNIRNLFESQIAEWDWENRNQMPQLQQESVRKQQKITLEQQQRVPQQQQQQEQRVPQQQQRVSQQTTSDQQKSDEQKSVPKQQKTTSEQEKTAPQQQKTTPDQQDTTQGGKRKYQQVLYPQLNASIPSSGSSDSSEEQSNSPESSVTTNRTTVSPPGVRSTEDLEGSKTIKRPRIDADKNLLQGGTAMERRLSQHPAKELAHYSPTEREAALAHIKAKYTFSFLGNKTSTPSDRSGFVQGDGGDQRWTYNSWNPAQQGYTQQSNRQQQQPGEQSQMTSTYMMQYQQSRQVPGLIAAESRSRPNVQSQQPHQPSEAYSNMMQDGQHQHLYQQQGLMVQGAENMFNSMVPLQQVSPAEQFEQIQFQPPPHRLQQNVQTGHLGFPLPQQQHYQPQFPSSQHLQHGLQFPPSEFQFYEYPVQQKPGDVPRGTFWT